MQNKIALEEHYEMSVDDKVKAQLAESEGFEAHYLDGVIHRALDVDARVAEMDRNGIGTMILSPSPPGPEMIADKGKAADLARRLNDYAAQNLVARYPDRLRAFAAVPLHDAEQDAGELERAVRDLGFVGALINGFTNISDTDQDEVQFLDEPQAEPFWDRVERLGVPVYLHPRPPTPATKRIFRGYQGLNGSVWGFHVDCATHVLRLMLSGLFDRHPGVNVILGHMGELLPFQLPRIDHRLRHIRDGAHGRHQQPLGYYLRHNFYITTAGVNDTPALLDTLLQIGTDRVLFSVDTPWEIAEEFAPWFDTCPISDNDRQKIGRTNAERLFGLKQPAA